MAFINGVIYSMPEFIATSGGTVSGFEATSDDAQSLAVMAEKLRIQRGTRRSWCWPVPSRAPKCTFTNEDTVTTFKMQDADAADLELPWLFDNDSRGVFVHMWLAVEQHVQIDPIFVAARSDTLVTSVTQATGTYARFGYSRQSRMNGWQQGQTSAFNTYMCASELIPNSLETSTRQALKIVGEYKVGDLNTLEAPGDDAITMSLDVYLVGLKAEPLIDIAGAGGG